MELVKLACPNFDENVRKTITKDYFVKGVDPDMQIALKSLANVSRMNINSLATETSRLQIADIDPFTQPKTYNDIDSNTLTINAVDETSQQRGKYSSR